MAPSPRAATALLAAALLAGCQGSQGANPRRPLQVPNAVSGGTRGGGRPEAPSLERMHEEEAIAAEKKEQKAEVAAAARDARAEALWADATARAQTAPGSAADEFAKIATDFKDSPHAEEARWREAEARFAVGDWFGAEAAAEKYLTDVPVNRHLAEAERIVYESSLEILRRTHGFAAIWKSNKRGFDGLRFLVDRMPEGVYADDALLALGDQYYAKEDWEKAAQSYKELLVRYPESPLRHVAHMKLGDAYLARDQGDAYHAGYVDVDPRSPASPQYLMSRPVRSTVDAAVAQYQAFLDGIAQDPAAARTMGPEIERARTMLATSRSRLAAKYREAAAFYAARGMSTGAEANRRYADNVEAGRPWSDGVAAAVVPAAVPARAPLAAPPPAPPRWGPPAGTAPRPVSPPVPPPRVERRVEPAFVVPPPPPPPPAPRPDVAPLPPAEPPASAIPTGSSTGTTSSESAGTLPPPRHVSGDGTSR